MFLLFRPFTTLKPNRSHHPELPITPYSFYLTSFSFLLRSRRGLRWRRGRPYCFRWIPKWTHFVRRGIRGGGRRGLVPRWGRTARLPNSGHFCSGQGCLDVGRRYDRRPCTDSQSNRAYLSPPSPPFSAHHQDTSKPNSQHHCHHRYRVDCRHPSHTSLAPLPSTGAL